MVQKAIGILTSGGDCPGLNAAIRGVGKAARSTFDMQVIGFRDGFRGLVENRTIRLGDAELSGILTLGGTILGTSRDKPHKMPVGTMTMDMTDVAVDNYHKHHLDVLVCLGGGGTQKNAFRLMKEGLNIITLPKTIDNDVWGTDCTELIQEGTFGVMVAIKGAKCAPVPLKKVAGRCKTVPPDHPWIRSARLVGTCLGD